MSDQSERVATLLRSTRAPTWTGLIGYGIVVVAFFISVLNALLSEPIAFLAKILTPLIFVGLANLLYHIGQHVHVLHVNALRMMDMDQKREGADKSAGHEQS